MNAGGYPELPLAEAPGFDYPTFLASWLPDDPYQPDDGCLEHFTVKARIAATLKPDRVVEIGVRAGYSALAFHMGHPYTEFYGLDMDEGGWGGVAGYLAVARQKIGALPGVSATLERGSSQRVKVLPTQARGAGLFHVDGEHTPKGAAHDIILGLHNGARYVVVDDADDPYVLEGTYWAIKTLGLQAWYVGDGGYRGNVVIARRAA